jgi:hypothetical protein
MSVSQPARFAGAARRSLTNIRAVMSPEKSRYISLLALAADWGAEAGVPRELVLRRLCEWAMAGAFPEGAFITATGAQVRPFDIYMSFRAFADDNNGLLSRGIDVDRWTFYNTNQQWGVHVLGERSLPPPMFPYSASTLKHFPRLRC